LPIINGIGRDVGISVIFKERASFLGSITILFAAAASVSVGLALSANDGYMPASIKAALPQNALRSFCTTIPPVFVGRSGRARNEICLQSRSAF
jgi:hypothetical protein